MLNFCMKVGLLGEKLQIYTAGGSSKVQWESFQSSTKPLTWYKVYYQLTSLKFVVPIFPLNQAWILRGIQLNILEGLYARVSHYHLIMY